MNAVHEWTRSLGCHNGRHPLAFHPIDQGTRSGTGLRFTYGVPSRSASLRLPNLKNPAQDRHSGALHAVPSYGDVIPRLGVHWLRVWRCPRRAKVGRSLGSQHVPMEMFAGVLDRLDGHLQ